jgi:hypothetical protein
MVKLVYGVGWHICVSGSHQLKQQLTTPAPPPAVAAVVAAIAAAVRVVVASHLQLGE